MKAQVINTERTSELVFSLQPSDKVIQNSFYEPDKGHVIDAIISLPVNSLAHGTSGGL